MVLDSGASDEQASAGRPAVREVKSAARTVEVLELLAARRNRPARLRDLSDDLGAPRSSVYAVLRTLVDRGWVRTDATGTLYSIGIQALMAGTTYLDADPVLRIVQPQVSALSRALGETIHYGRLQATEIVYLATEESRHYVRPFSRLGRRLPAYSNALGKSLLAARMREGGIEELTAHLPGVMVPITPHTITDPDTLVDDLRATQARGYAVDRNESFEGVSCFAFAMQFAHHLSSDAISCSVPIERLADGRENEILDALRHTKQTIEAMAPDTVQVAYGPDVTPRRARPAVRDLAGGGPARAGGGAR